MSRFFYFGAQIVTSENDVAIFLLRERGTQWGKKYWFILLVTAGDGKAKVGWQASG
jgi:hypothetical protein